MKKIIKLITLSLILSACGSEAPNGTTESDEVRYIELDSTNDFIVLSAPITSSTTQHGECCTSEGGPKYFLSCSGPYSCFMYAGGLTAADSNLLLCESNKIDSFCEKP